LVVVLQCQLHEQYVSYIRDENMVATRKKMTFEVVYIRHCNCCR